MSSGAHEITVDHKSPRLLAVDDDPTTTQLVARIAQRCGYDAQCLTDPRGVPEAVKNWRPDVISLDLSMPDRNGFEVLAGLQDSGFSGALIIVSGQEDWLRKTACSLAQVSGIRTVSQMHKPIDVHSLRDLLDALRILGTDSAPKARAG